MSEAQRPSKAKLKSVKCILKNKKPWMNILKNSFILCYPHNNNINSDNSNGRTISLDKHIREDLSIKQIKNCLLGFWFSNIDDSTVY